MTTLKTVTADGIHPVWLKFFENCSSGYYKNFTKTQFPLREVIAFELQPYRAKWYSHDNTVIFENPEYLTAFY